MRAIFTLLSLIFLATGCSKGRDDQRHFKNENEARKALTGDQVVCKGVCPEYIGAFYLSYKSPKGSGFDMNLCSATLISKTEVLTNKHCIEDILKEGDLCTDKAFIEIKFPKTDKFPLESFRCKKILKTSKDYFLSGKKGPRRRAVPDWAIVELDVGVSSMTDREPITMAAGSISDNTRVDLFPVYFDMSYSPAKGTIKPVQCTQTFKETNLFADDTDSPLFQMKNCTEPLVHGNSGSGVFLHGESKLLGIMATSDDKKQISSGTAAHCIPNFSDSSQDCLFSEDRHFTEIMKAYFYLNTYMQKDIANAADEQNFESPYIKWSTKRLSSESFKNLTMTYAAPWDGHIGYLQAHGNQRWQTKLELALARVMFLRAPECALPAAISNSVQLNLATLKDWNFLKSFEWDESAVNTGDGDYTVNTHTRITGTFIDAVNTTFKGAASDGGILLSATGDLPGAAKSIKIQLPACH